MDLSTDDVFAVLHQNLRGWHEMHPQATLAEIEVEVKLQLRRVWTQVLEVMLADMQRLGGLPSAREARRMWGDIWYRETHNSTALEGNALSSRAVAELLIEGKPVDDALHRDYLEVRGYADAAQWVYAQAVTTDDGYQGELLSLHEVRQVHHSVMGPVWEQYPHSVASGDEGPGNFREHDIMPFDGGMQPPSWTDVPSLMRTWIDSVNTVCANDEVPIVEQVAEMHAEYERIHPFLDGNGRTGRLLVNLLLVRLGYPPAIILKERREQYLQALQAADAGDNCLLGQCLARAIQFTMKEIIFPAITGPARFILLSAFADDEFSTAQLSYAARHEQVEAEKDGDGFWRSTRVAVEEFKQARREERAQSLKSKSNM